MLGSLASPAHILSQQMGLPQAVLAAQAPGIITGLQKSEIEDYFFTAFMDAFGIVYLAFFDDQELPLQKPY